MPAMTPAATVAAGRGRRHAAAALTVVLLVAGCGSAPSPSASPTASPPPFATVSPAPSPDASATPIPPGDLAALYARIEDEVIAERGLPAKARIVPTILSEAELRARMEEQFGKDNPPDEVAIAQGTLQGLGLLPAGASLADLYIELLASQVAGYYDPETKQLYVVSRSGTIGATEKVTVAHELTHALQDQSFGLAGIDVDAVGQGDRSLARLALVEGDATLLMTKWLTKHLGAAELGELLKVDPEAQALLDGMPAILRETLLFPYQQGLVFVNGLWMSGGWEAVDRAYGRLPASTEQVLHPDKYAAGEEPVTVALDAAALAKALGAGWVATPEDTLGEFQLSVWLRENGVPALDAQAAAAGWGGDRLVYLRGPDGAYGIVLATAWDTAADTAEFRAAATRAAGRLPGAARVLGGSSSGASGRPGEVLVLAASDAATLGALADAVAAAGP